MGNNPAEFKACGDSCPVENVSWDDVQVFIKKLNAQTAGGYRLPTEAEWEYACRSGGKEQTYCGGNNPKTLAWWYDANSGEKTHPVGQKQANGLGLYDMSGNVWEWTCSAYAENYDGSEQRCSSDANARRVLRGGSWDDRPGSARAAHRLWDGVAVRDNAYGFRLAQDR